LRFLLNDSWLTSTLLSETDLAMAKWAMFQLQVLKLALQSLVFAGFASVVLFSQDTLATSNAW
jgi:hypothetical protein